MAIDKIFNDGNVDGIADNIFNAVNNSVSEVKQMQQRKAAENAQMVVQSLKKIDTDIREKYDNVTNTLEKRIITIKDGRDGINGKDGRDGKDGKAGRDGKDGKQGIQGLKGQDGIDGLDGVSVVNAHIDFDGSLIIDLSTGTAINVGEVVSPDLADKIQVISTMSTNGAVGIKDEGSSISTGVKNINFVGAAVTATNSGDDVTVNVSAGTGTVTSVAATVPTFLSVSGSPITTSGTLAISLSGTALPVANGGTGITSFGTGVATFLGTPSSANLAAAVTNETGSGSLVFATSPTLVTPILGTPSSGTLTSCTGLPISTGVSGLGTGVATALAVNVGTAGAPVVNGGALGTPSSGTVTNLTGTASININGTVGATTASSGAFTTLSATGVTTVQAGTAALPAITTSGDTNTGIFFPAADTIAFAEGGVEAARFDSSGNFGLGVTPSANTVSGSGYRQIEVGTTVGNMIFAGGNEMFVSQNVIYNSGWKYAVSTLASQYRLNAGRHEFYTAPTGTAGNTATFTQAMTLNANGVLALQGASTSANGVGITFPATQSASSDANTLDDYEEGTWTPVLTRTGSSYTFNGQGGVYTKIGNVVTVQFSCDITAIGTQGTGYNSISGLPFAPFVYAGAGRSTAALSFNSVLTSATAMYYASSWFFTDGTNALQTNFTTGSFSGSITYTV